MHVKENRKSDNFEKERKEEEYERLRSGMSAIDHH